MAELKPCPFCGGKAYLAEHDVERANGKPGKHYTITCDRCLARVDCADKEVVIIKWNRRAGNG